MKYRLKKNVRIVLRRHGIVAEPKNFNDSIAELILTDPHYSEAYGHNVEVLDAKTLELLKKRKQVTQAEPLVFEIDIKKKSSARTSTSTEAKKDASKSSRKSRKPKSSSSESKASSRKTKAKD